jgi:S1-C subfamily serine protease
MADVLKELSDAMANAVESLTPSIVSVNARRRLPATGIVWSSDGIIVTANHVVERDDELSVTLADGTTHDASLMGRDPANDLAVLKVNATLTAAKWGDNQALKVGHLVLALGRPGEQVQATLGVVSALHQSAAPRQDEGRRRKRAGRRMMQVLVDGYIQTDVVMYPGFSGGPLVSGDGAIHGLNTSGFGHGASVAVPIATIRNTVKTLKEHGKMKQGYLGVGVQPVRLPDNVTKELGQETGLLTVSVESDSPAAKGGLFVGDIIVALDNQSTEQLDELLAMLSGERVGKSVPVKIVRGGAVHNLSVMIGERS